MVVVSLLPLVDIDPWDQLPAFVRPKYWRLCVSCAQPEAHHSVSRPPLTRPTYKPCPRGAAPFSHRCPVIRDIHTPLGIRPRQQATIHIRDPELSERSQSRNQ